METYRLTTRSRPREPCLVPISARPDNCEESLVRTDVVIESGQDAREFYRLNQRLGTIAHFILGRKSCIPLSPFMITHIREPTHRSISSKGDQLDLSKRSDAQNSPSGSSCVAVGVAAAITTDMSVSTRGKMLGLKILKRLQSG